jgi:hypothetical protein
MSFTHIQSTTLIRLLLIFFKCSPLWNPLLHFPFTPTTPYSASPKSRQLTLKSWKQSDKFVSVINVFLCKLKLLLKKWRLFKCYWWSAITVLIYWTLYTYYRFFELNRHFSKNVSVFRFITVRSTVLYAPSNVTLKIVVALRLLITCMFHKNNRRLYIIRMRKNYTQNLI